MARIASSHLYHDDRLVYGSGPVELGTYEYQRWAEPPAEMVQDALVSSLRSTGQYRSVSAIGSNLKGEYILRGRLYALDEVDNPEITARFSIGLELFDTKTGATLWTNSYSHDAPVTGKTVPDVVQALDQNVRAGLSSACRQPWRIFCKPPAAAPKRAIASFPQGRHVKRRMALDSSGAHPTLCLYLMTMRRRIQPITAHVINAPLPGWGTYMHSSTGTKAIVQLRAISSRMAIAICGIRGWCGFT